MYIMIQLDRIFLSDQNNTCSCTHYSGSETRSKAFMTSSRRESAMNPLSGKQSKEKWNKSIPDQLLERRGRCTETPAGEELGSLLQYSSLLLGTCSDEFS